MEEQNKLTIYSNLSNSDSNNNTDEIFDKYTKKNNESNKNKKFNNKIIELNFDSNQIINNNNNYKKLCKYIKKNYNDICDMLYQKKIIKNKNIPFRILFHIYVNYLNNDMELVFL